MTYKALCKTCCFFLLAILAFACNDVKNQSITIHRFDLDVMEYPKMATAQQEQFTKNYAPIINLYINKIYPSDEISLSDKLNTFVNSDAINFFRQDVAKEFNSLSDIENDLGEEQKAFADKFGIQFPVIYSAIIPYNQSVILNDSIAIIGLNHYLGASYKPYEYFPEYKRRFKIRDKIKYDVAEAVLKTNYPYTPKDGTLLERMVYEGAIACSMKTVVPNYNDSTCLSFKKQQLAWCDDNEKKIWNQLLIDDILYSTDPVLMKSVLDPAPFCEIFTQESPGQIGRWIGMKIIEAYLSNSDDSLRDMLSSKSYQQSQKLLITSSYNGK